MDKVAGNGLMSTRFDGARCWNDVISVMARDDFFRSDLGLQQQVR
jgi:hypothetical protein